MHLVWGLLFKSIGDLDWDACIVNSKFIAFQSKHFLHVWHNGVGFPVRHCLPAYPHDLRFLIYTLSILSHEDLLTETCYVICDGI